MKLIVDFDDVLFKTSILKAKFFSVLADHGVKNAEEHYKYERTPERPFSLELFLKRICKEENISDISAGLLYEEIMEVCSECVNETMVQLLTDMGAENCFIVTNGDEEFQKEKLVRSGIYTLVREVTIVPGSKKEKVEAICAQFPDEEITFVDDKSRFFDDIDMEQCKNLKTVLFDENGFENLKAEMEASRAEEANKKPQPPTTEPSGPKMK
jgi:FMN phosphatase YigB (HAD superfamily)